MTVNQLYRDLDSVGILEWIAYDKTNSKEWLEEYQKEVELRKSEEMSREEYIAALESMFGFKGK